MLNIANAIKTIKSHFFYPSDPRYLNYRCLLRTSFGRIGNRFLQTKIKFVNALDLKQCLIHQITEIAPDVRTYF